MNILLTLDYELFLGSKTGSVQACLINPMNQIIHQCKTEVKLTLFVDASYLYRLNQYKGIFPQLESEYETIKKHLKELSAEGHDIQLHIHPHWATSTFDGTEWHLDYERYKLCDLNKNAATQLFIDSKHLLDEIIGKETKIFRAGGFSAQPTSLLTSLFEKTDITADCSVCPGMTYDSLYQKYNYKLVSGIKSIYRFKEDICKEDYSGRFREIPITTAKVSPLFNWKYAISRILKSPKHHLIGDGQGIKATHESIFDRLFHKTTCILTIDGIKISLLPKQYTALKKSGLDNMCVIGHPKLATPYSIDKLGKFIQKVHENGDRFITISQLLEKTL